MSLDTLNSRNSSWSIACLKEYLRKKRGLTVVCCSRKPSFLNAKHLSLNRHLAYTLRCVYTPMFFQVQPETKKKKKKKKKKEKKSLLEQTSPALQPLPLAFCQLPIMSGFSIWPRRRRGQTYRFPYVYSTCFVLSLGTHAGEKKTPMALLLLWGSV